MGLFRRAQALFVLAGLAAALGLVACSGTDGPGGPYDLVIQVYDPLTGTAADPVEAYCNAWLYDAAGTELAVGEETTYANWPRFERTLDSGTYYVKVMGDNPGQEGRYAICAVPAGDDPPLFGSALGGNGADYEPDDASSGDVPSNPAPLALGSGLNRYLAPTETDWVKIHLP